MVLLCFLLDLRSLSPSLLRDLKQSLLQLSNFYAVSSPWRSQSESLRGRFGLCYLFKNTVSSSDELKVAHSPRGNFSLRDFHHAVNNLPTDAFLPEISGSGSLCSRDVKLSSVLSDQVLYSWGGKDIVRKVIFLSSSLPQKVDSALKKTLMDAADKCVSVEFILLEQKSNHLVDIRESINSFVSSISDLDNCSFQSFLPDVKVFHSLIKRWLQDLKDDMEEPFQARFIFKGDLVGSVKQISCNLSASVSHIVDGFTPHQTCSCHGIALGNAVKNRTGRPSCPVTGGDLKAVDVIENSVKVGEKTILFMPSFQSSVKLQQVSSPVDFNIIQRTNLGSLSEGVIFGDSYIVTPSASSEIDGALDETEQSELNAQLFRALCGALHSLDQGLVCSAKCNIQSMRETAFHCYYILQPSNGGPMLLRRLAGSEEILPVPDFSQFVDCSVPKEIEISIQTCLLKLDSRDYNPVLYERGFHQKLNLLVKESLQFGSVPPKVNDATPEQNSSQPKSSQVTLQSTSAVNVVVVEDETAQPDQIEEKTTASIAEEWEQLVVGELPEKYSPSCISKHKLEESVLSPIDINRQLDVKTSRILERLEVPRQLKSKAISPTITGSSVQNACVPVKKPLIPFQSNQAADQSSMSSELMKPNFQRLKRKHK
ncbi:hypothetical protein SLA2020_140660 [Shorea laevis]